MQKLIHPINKCGVTASWKAKAYISLGYGQHYGVDLICSSKTKDRRVYASGNGLVVATGKDRIVGNVVVVLYKNAYNHRTGAVKDLIVRDFHLDSVSVKKGQKVTKDTLLGYYGNTGSLIMGKHLHREVDTDTAYPLYSPTVSDSNLVRGKRAGASDKTMSNPLGWFHTKPSEPDYQTYTTTGDSFIRAEDRTAPKL